MTKKEFQEARDFAGADWENLTQESRSRLLQRSNLSKYYSGIRWGMLPPTVKKDLAMTLLEQKRR